MDIKLVDKEYVADVLNKYFSNIVVSFKNKVEAVNSSFDEYLSASVSSYIFLYNTNHIEVSKVISNMNVTSNTIKKIGSKTLKIVNTSLSLPISKICNPKIKSGLYPSRLKITNVIPLFKSGNKKEIFKTFNVKILYFVFILSFKFI